MESCLEPFREFAGDGAEIAVDLGGGRAEDQVADGAFGELNVLVASEDVDFAVGEDDASLGDVFDGELRSSALASKATDSPAQVITSKRFHILHLERLQEQVF